MPVSERVLQTVRTRLRTAVHAAEAHGIYIRPGLFGLYGGDLVWRTYNGVCDPLGAMLIGEAITVPNRPETDLARVLQISEDQVQSIAAGFDLKRPTGWHDREFYALGKQLREELIQRSNTC